MTNQPMIRFKFDNKVYQVPMGAYNADRIMLPDSTLLRVLAWSESMPPKPLNLEPEENPELGDQVPRATEVTS